MTIYRVVQILLLILLMYMTFNFQQMFSARGKPGQLLPAIVAGIASQILLFYPIYRLALRDVGIESEGATTGLSPGKHAELRKKRLLGDMYKIAGIAFYMTFVAIMPDVKKSVGAQPVLAATVFSFLLACLSYFQCFNHSMRKRISGG